MPGRKRCRCVSSASPQILYFTNGHLYPTGSKAKRASLLQNPPTGGVATLKLSNVHLLDTGTYLCHVNNPPDFYTNGLGLINLTVLGKAGQGPTSHSHTLLAPLNPPYTDCPPKHTTLPETPREITSFLKSSNPVTALFHPPQRVLLLQSLVTNVLHKGSESCPQQLHLWENLPFVAQILSLLRSVAEEGTGH